MDYLGDDCVTPFPTVLYAQRQETITEEERYALLPYSVSLSPPRRRGMSLEPSQVSREDTLNHPGNTEYRLDAVEKKVERHDHILRGNGTEGIVAKVAQHDTFMKEVRRNTRWIILFLATLAVKAVWDLIVVHH